MTTGIQTFAGSDVIMLGNLTVLGAITGSVTVTGSSFTSIIDTSLTVNGFMYPILSGITPGLLTSTAAATNGQLLIGSTGSAPVAGTITGTANEIIVTNGAGTITLSTPQPINTTSSPTFSDITLTSVAANSFLLSGTGGLVSTTSAPTNGQLLVGSTGSAPVAATVTGTTNEIIVTNGPGTITLSTPQAINTTSSVTFANVTDSGLTPNAFMYPGAAGLLSTTAAATNGQVLIGSTGNPPVAATLTAGSAISISTAPGSISINNTGVTGLTAGSGIGLSGSVGSVTVSTLGQYFTHAVTTSSYNVSTTDTYVGINFAGAVTINLPAGSSVVQGKFYFFKDESGVSSVNNVTINANGADTIDGQSSIILALNYINITLMWNTNHWSII